MEETSGQGENFSDTTQLLESPGKLPCSKFRGKLLRIKHFNFTNLLFPCNKEPAEPSHFPCRSLSRVCTRIRRTERGKRDFCSCKALGKDTSWSKKTPPNFTMFVSITTEQQRRHREGSAELRTLGTTCPAFFPLN